MDHQDPALEPDDSTHAVVMTDAGRSADPLLVEVTRGALVESRHRGRAAIVDAHARVLVCWGDLDRPVYPRSAVKPLQALPLVESGAADAFALTETELALACASHNGEPAHTQTVAAWLARIGCTVDDLACGAHEPVDGGTARAMIRAGEPAMALHNNCSGKHAGFLTTARHKGEPVKGYIDYVHPVQQRLLGVLEQMTGQDLGTAAWARDGCSIPTIAVPLGALALGMARFADPHGVPELRADAIMRIRRAWGGQAYHVAGRGRFDTAVMTATGGRVLVKEGAEAVSCACLPELGLGIALKIEDGNPRAAYVAMAALLRHVGAVEDAAWPAIAEPSRPPVRTRRGVPVGEVRPAAGFPARTRAS